MDCRRRVARARLAVSTVSSSSITLRRRSTVTATIHAPRPDTRHYSILDAQTGNDVSFTALGTGLDFRCGHAAAAKLLAGPLIYSQAL